MTSCAPFFLNYMYSSRKKKPVGGVALFPGGADLFGRSSKSEEPTTPMEEEEQPIKSPAVQPKPSKKKASVLSPTGGLFDEGGGADEDDIFSFSPSAKKK